MLIHTALFALQSWAYFEWVSSESNWADGISRTGLEDEWHQRHQFSPSRCVCEPDLLRLPLKAAATVFDFLRKESPEAPRTLEITGWYPPRDRHRGDPVGPPSRLEVPSPRWPQWNSALGDRY